MDENWVNAALVSASLMFKDISIWFPLDIQVYIPLSSYLIRTGDFSVPIKTFG